MQKNSKGKYIFNTVLTVVTLLIILFNIAFYILDAFSYDLGDLPEGELLYASMSPTSEYIMTAYYIPATDSLSDGVRCEITEVATDKKRNIYWQTGIDNAITSWAANNIVNINGVSIDVTKPDVYDFRKTVK